MTATTVTIVSSFSWRGKDKAPDSFSYRKTGDFFKFVLFPFWSAQNESDWQYQNHGNMMQQQPIKRLIG